MKKIILIIFVCAMIAGLPVMGQPAGAGARPGMANMPADGKITGKLIDATTNQPVEYASIAIYREKDSTLVTGVVSDATGAFLLENLPYGKFYADITFIGYKKSHINDISIIPNKKIASLGTVKLDLSSTALNEVVVVGNGSSIEYKIDKKVVNVSQNIIAAGGTVVDALQNTPSVQTDVEGNVTVRGSSNFTVLIDGKPSVVTGSEALQQIPASLVQNVEIITNPSAKYDAEGSAGIINVIMKKQKVKGFNGSVSLSAGTNRKYNENFNLNYKYDKFNFSIGADYADMAFKMTNTSERQYLNAGEITKDQVMQGSGQFSRKGKGVKAGIDYYLNSKNTISLSGRVGDRGFNRPMTALYTDYYPLTDDYIYYKSINTGDSKDKFYSLNLDYTLLLDDKGQQISATAYYSKSNENDPSIMFQDTTDNLWSTAYSRYSQRIEETGDENEFRFKADYTLPITDKSKFEAGVQSRMDNNSASHRLFENEIENLGQVDELDFKDNINAAYATYSNSTKLFDFQLGLRAENENRVVNQKNLNQDTTVKRTDFFPTVHISKQLPWDLQLQVSYTRRINRPRQFDLSPLKRYMDPQNVRVGNPGILPEFTDAYELNVQKKLNEMSFVSIEGFYRKTNNPIQQKISTIDNINYMTVQNLGKDESLGAEVMLNLGITKWWSLTSSGSLYNYKLTGDMENADSKSSTNWNLRANSVIRLKTGTTFQLNYMYNAPSITAQGTRGAFYTTSFAIRQDLLKKKASLTLQLRDMIGDMRMKMTAETSNMNSNFLMKRESKVVTVTFTYRINNYKAAKQGGGEEMNNSGGDTGGEMF